MITIWGTVGGELSALEVDALARDSSGAEWLGGKSPTYQSVKRQSRYESDFTSLEAFPSRMVRLTIRTSYLNAMYQVHTNGSG